MKDCTKTVDFMEEYTRMHKMYSSDVRECVGCPLKGEMSCDPMYWKKMNDLIAIVQKWSDEHPEAPKLTRKEYDFLTSFDANALSIEKMSPDRLYVVQHSPVDVNTILIDPNSFSFINVGEIWYFTKLLNLEVEE